tara:strand:+ start:78 stop:212 length:135 start_codon:yes stop_codon:yes gene_type:complete
MLDQIKAIAEDEHLLAFLTTLLVFVIAFGLYWETTMVHGRVVDR